MKKQIGGILTLIAFGLMLVPAGWWFLHRGGVVDHVELFKQARISTADTGRFKSYAAVGDGIRGAWELGPYDLEPDDSPLSITGVFTSAGDLAHDKPAFTLKGYLFDEDGQQVWDGSNKISWARPKSDAQLSHTELTLGMVPITAPGNYTLLCNTDDEMVLVGGMGNGAMKLDMVVRKQAKAFPFIPVAVGFVVLIVVIFGFGEKVRQCPPA